MAGLGFRRAEGIQIVKLSGSIGRMGWRSLELLAWASATRISLKSGIVEDMEGI